MNETLNLRACRAVNMRNLSKGQFPRRHNTAASVFQQQLCTVSPCNCHLRTGVNRQIRKALPDVMHDADILYNYCVKSRLVQRTKVIVQLPNFLLLQQCVDCQVQLFSPDMHIINRREHLLLRKIPSVCSRAKLVSRRINRICPCIYGCLQNCKGTRRSQKLCLFAQTAVPPVFLFKERYAILLSYIRFRITPS